MSNLHNVIAGKLAETMELSKNVDIMYSLLHCSQGLDKEKKKWTRILHATTIEQDGR